MLFKQPDASMNVSRKGHGGCWKARRRRLRWMLGRRSSGRRRRLHGRIFCYFVRKGYWSGKWKVGRRYLSSNVKNDTTSKQTLFYLPEANILENRRVYGHRLCLLFSQNRTTDLAIIRNCDADAVFAVYPFTPQQAISDAIIKAS